MTKNNNNNKKLGTTLRIIQALLVIQRFFPFSVLFYSAETVELYTKMF